MLIDVPNMTMKTPPIMGSGMVTKSAPNLPKTPNMIIITAPTCITLRLATYNINIKTFKLLTFP